MSLSKVLQLKYAIPTFFTDIHLLGNFHKGKFTAALLAQLVELSTGITELRSRFACCSGCEFFWPS